MARALDSAFFAGLGRDYLIALPFAPAASTAIWKQFGTPAAWIAQRLCLEFPAEMAALRDQIESKAKTKAVATLRTTAPPFPAAAADAQAALALAEQRADRERIERAFQVGDFSPSKAGNVTNVRNIQYFGQPPSGQGGR